jgi:hypothetical protein
MKKITMNFFFPEIYCCVYRFFPIIYTMNRDTILYITIIVLLFQLHIYEKNDEQYFGKVMHKKSIQAWKIISESFCIYIYIYI